MPFRSEKQRRYLWATQPDLAREWAHKYPQKKKLPLYVRDKKQDSTESEKAPEKKQAGINMAKTGHWHKNVCSPGLAIYRTLSKKAESAAVKIEIPHSEKPVAAGDESISAQNETAKNEGADECENTDSAHVSSLMSKLSVVLSQKIQQAIADDEAARAGAEAAQVPQNAGLKNYPPSAPAIPPPMGMTAGADPAAAQAQGTIPPVGGGSHPSANPINSYGGLSVNGDINGNAAFGAPGGSKTAGKLGLWDRIRAKKERGEKPAKPGDKDYPDSKSWKKVTGISEKKSAEGQKAVACSCGCGDTVETCKCGPDCSCRKPGGSCYKGEKQAVNWRALMQNISKNSKTYLDRLTGKSIIPLKQKARLADERHNKWLRVEGKVTEKYKPSVRDPNPPPIVKLFYGEHDGGAGNAGGLATARWLGNPRSPVDRSFKMLNKAQRAMWDEEKAIASTRRNTGFAGLGALGLGGLAANYLRPEEKSAAMPDWYGAETSAYTSPSGKDIGAGVYHGLPVGPKDKQPAFMAKILGGGTRTVAQSRVPEIVAALKKIKNIDVADKPVDGTLTWGWGVNDQVPYAGTPEMQQAIEQALRAHKPAKPEKQASSPAWQRSEGKNQEGGLNAKGRASYNKATGGNLKAPVTESNPKGDRAKRQNSFCSRMCGMKRVNTGSKTKSDPDSRINKSLRKWNCKCSSAMEFGIKIASYESVGGDLGGAVGTVAGGGVGLLGANKLTQLLENPAAVRALQMQHLRNFANQTVLQEVRKAMGKTPSLGSQLSGMASRGALTGLKYLPKTRAGQLAAVIGTPIAAGLGLGLAGKGVGSAIGSAFDK